MVADIEELEQMHASELHARRLNAKEVLTPTSVEKLRFPIEGGTVKLAGGDQVLKTSFLIRDRTRFTVLIESHQMDRNGPGGD